MTSWVLIEFVAAWAGEPPPVVTAAPDSRTAADAGISGHEAACPPSGDVGIPISPIWRF